MKNKYNKIILALIIAVVIWGIIAALAYFTEIRLFTLLGGVFPYGFIQLLTYFLFIWGVLEIRDRNKAIKEENKSFEVSFLPESRQYLIDNQQVNTIRQNIMEYENHTKYILTDLIRKACNKYLTNHSTAEVLGVVARQSEINYAKEETEQSIVRYIAYAIPSVGFIGTIIGISRAIGLASVVSQGEIKPVTDLLYVAFDTTLVALILSLILTYLLTDLQKSVANFHNKTEEYVVENLVNRISTNLQR